uniref:J domain-containing protein n=1 Tax=Lactuca sativa TaxID=4236 RepID=A0A9R1VLP0_LACSA|nr:hypothetical protein LSAT_V11C500236910 [Lactuca sativa]
MLLQQKEVATVNFQRICEAYEILTDENKRQIYDIYGMEGLTSGLELCPKLNKVEEIKEELQRLKRRREEEKTSAHFQPSGVILAQLSVPRSDSDAAANAVFRHQLSSISSIEFIASAGLRGLIGFPFSGIIGNGN